MTRQRDQLQRSLTRFVDPPVLERIRAHTKIQQHPQLQWVWTQFSSCYTVLIAPPIPNDEVDVAMIHETRTLP